MSVKVRGWIQNQGACYHRSKRSSYHMTPHDDYFVIAEFYDYKPQYLPNGRCVTYNAMEIKVYHSFDELVTAMRNIAPLSHWSANKYRGFKVGWLKHQADWN